jgi:hypothetical protein
LYTELNYRSIREVGTVGYPQAREVKLLQIKIGGIEYDQAELFEDGQCIF